MAKGYILQQNKTSIHEAALTLLCYNWGYKKGVVTTQVEYWINNIEQSAMMNEAGKSKTSYTDTVTNIYPTYLHKM